MSRQEEAVHKELDLTYHAAKAVMGKARPETIEDLIRNGHGAQPWTAEDVRQLKGDRNDDSEKNRHR